MGWNICRKIIIVIKQITKHNSDKNRQRSKPIKKPIYIFKIIIKEMIY